MNDLQFVFYINAKPQVVWAALSRGEPIVSAVPGTELRGAFEPGAAYAYVGKAPDGTEMTYVSGSIVSADPAKHLEMTYRSMVGALESRVVYVLEEIAGKYTKLSVTQDRFQDGDPNYVMNADGWPQLLSNLKSVIETGQVMKYHA